MAGKVTRYLLYPRVRKAGFFGAQDGRALVNLRVLIQLIKHDERTSNPLFDDRGERPKYGRQ